MRFTAALFVTAQTGSNANTLHQVNVPWCIHPHHTTLLSNACNSLDKSAANRPSKKSPSPKVTYGNHSICIIFLKRLNYYRTD